MRRALVTGATGGLGMTLVRTLLEEGYAVRATGRNLARGAWLAALGAEFQPLDLEAPGATEGLTTGVDAVFHAAARSSPWGTDSEFATANVQMTRRLLEAATRAGVSRFLYVSTPSIYGEPRDRLGLTEQSPLPRTFENTYTATKYAAEQEVLAADRPGMRTLALRPRAIVGPWDQVLIPRLRRIAERGVFPLFRGGQAKVEITDARDVADALVHADRSDAHGRAYNISGGSPLSVRALLELAFAALELKPRLVPVPFRVASQAAHGLEALCAALPGRPEPPVTRYSLNVLAFSQTFDLSAAYRDLDWRPRYSPKEAIDSAVMGGPSHA